MASTLRSPLGLRIDYDLYFTADLSLSAYADIVRAEGRVTA